MPTERHHVAAQLGDIDRNPPERLGRIEMKNRPRTRGRLGHCGPVLNRSHLGISERDRNQGGIGIDRGNDLPGDNRPSRSGTTLITSEPRASNSASAARMEECSIAELTSLRREERAFKEP